MWEYNVALATNPLSGPTLNSLGAAGWELVAIVQVQTSLGDEFHYVFKRPTVEKTGAADHPESVVYTEKEETR